MPHIHKGTNKTCHNNVTLPTNIQYLNIHVRTWTWPQTSQRHTNTKQYTMITALLEVGMLEKEQHSHKQQTWFNAVVRWDRHKQQTCGTNVQNRKWERPDLGWAKLYCPWSIQQLTPVSHLISTSLQTTIRFGNEHNITNFLRKYVNGCTLQY
jgi:hypothetical protein